MKMFWNKKKVESMTIEQINQIYEDNKEDYNSAIKFCRTKEDRSKMIDKFLGF